MPLLATNTPALPTAGPSPGSTMTRAPASFLPSAVPQTSDPQTAPLDVVQVPGFGGVPRAPEDSQASFPWVTLVVAVVATAVCGCALLVVWRRRAGEVRLEEFLESVDMQERNEGHEHARV
eukprot:TRINITY_DN7686_c0_g1_i1.p1 TRINITY_DN7686_c0_g1~~TRINITY_DN7686_c0_g1_i1.p1  ORF type:complete len:121 (+),score=9.11 TRINITY_DN7686_c0_g1_i1:267-629(+)